MSSVNDQARHVEGMCMSLETENANQRKENIRQRTLIAKRHFASDEKDPRHGKEQVKPLARAKAEKDERDRHKDGEYEQRVGKVGQLPNPDERLPLVQMLESVRASLERHGGRVLKQRAF